MKYLIIAAYKYVNHEKMVDNVLPKKYIIGWRSKAYSNI